MTGGTVAGVADGRELFLEAFVRGLEPTAVVSVSTWADANRVLSSVASHEHGKWRTSRTPYLRAIMDALGPDDPCERVVFMKGAQVGATEAGNNWICYTIAADPAPMMMLLPTLELARRGSKQRLDPMIADTPAIREIVQPRRARDAGNTMLFKEFPGGVLALTGANSPAGLRSMTMRKLFCDEVDAYPGSVGDEGDPLVLARRGMRTYQHRSKEFDVSTPTFQGRSRIEREFLESSRCYYYVPCPFCAELQRIEWKQLEWDDDDPDTVRLVCVSCDAAIVEAYKTAMLAAGEWIAEAPELSETVQGFHLSALYSPIGWRSWSQIVELFLKGMGKLPGGAGVTVPEVLRVWTNQDLGETWAEKGDAPPWETLFNRRELYEIGVVPDGACVLVAGTDVQGDRTETEIVAYGPDRESWSVAYVVQQGDPAQEELWLELDRLLATPWPIGSVKSSRTMLIRMLAIDCGFATQHVRQWVRRQERNRVIGVRGRGSFYQPIGQPLKVDVLARTGRKLRRGVLEWPVGVDVLKSELYGWLKMPQPTDPEATGYPPGYVHFPQYGEEWFKQLTAEHLVRTINKKGYAVYEWQAKRPRNEALDCRVYARAALAQIGADRWGPEQWEIQRSLSGSELPEPRQRRHGRSSIAEQWRSR